MGNGQYSSDQRTHYRSGKTKTFDAIETPSEETDRDIPQDIIAEILVRLPVKSLLKFKCVTKSWVALISSPIFIKTHVKYSTNMDPTFSNYRLMLDVSYNQDHDNVRLGSVSLALRDLSTDAIGFDKKLTERLFHTHGSCNGLLCVSVYNSSIKDVFLWYPSLRISKKLPPPCGTAEELEKILVSKYHIVYDEPTDDYKVVGLFEYLCPWECKVEIYSLTHDSWKRIENFKGVLLRWFSMIYAYGKLHFTSCQGNDLSIVSFDLENEVFGTVEHLEVRQQKGYYSAVSLGVLEGCISAVYNNAQDYVADVKESWTKVASIPYVDGPPSTYNTSKLYHLSFSWNGKYLLGRWSQLLIYDPEDNSFVYPTCSLKVNHGLISWVGIYVESLVPLPTKTLP